MPNETPIQRLEGAGLLKSNKLTGDDRKVLEQLTEHEVTVLIELAKRLYPTSPGLVKLGDLDEGLLRICVPL